METWSLLFSSLKNLYNFILVLAPVLCLIYIIIGGIRITVSSGNTERLYKAKKTITYAIAGCVIVLLSYPILNFIAWIFAPAESNIFLDWYASAVTIVALIYMAYGGILYITSDGKPEQILEAKDRIMHAIMGYTWMLLVRLILSPFFK